MLHRIVVLLLCLGCTPPRIGVLTAADLAKAGRPNEALKALNEEPAPFRCLHQGMLLHQAERWSESTAVWSKPGCVPDARAPAALEGLRQSLMAAQGLPAERDEHEVLRHLMALNHLAITQSDSAWTLPEPLKPVPAGQAAIVVIVERGWRDEGPPDPRPTPPSVPAGAPAWNSTPRRPEPLAWPSPRAEVLFRVRLDDLAPVEAHPVLSEPELHRDPARPSDRWVWWSAPTSYAVAELTSSPGQHVLMLPKPHGFVEERLVLLREGQRLFLVTRL